MIQSCVVSPPRTWQDGSSPQIKMDNLKTLIREVPDFPKKGILFYDITTLLKDRDGLRGVIDGLKSHYSWQGRGRRGGY